MALILIGEESAVERRRLRQILEDRDWVIVEADNAPYCLELIEVHRIDCALLNVLMSGIEDFQVFQALENRNIPAIAISKADGEKAVQHWLAIGANAVLEEFPSAIEINQILSFALNLEQLKPPIKSHHTSEILLEKEIEEAIPLSIDTLKNLIGIAVEQAAEVLSELIDSPIHFEIPGINRITFDSLEPELEKIFGAKIICAAQLAFRGGFSGIAQLLFSRSSTELLTSAIAEEEPGSPDFEEAKEEMLTEVGNIVLNSIIGTIGNAITTEVTFDVPIYLEDSISNLMRATLYLDLQNKSPALTYNSSILLAQAAFTIQQLQVAGDIILCFRLDGRD
ncbi:MAG: response regulator [Prochloraceae cyanobacterium]|nr:response regulator [Prochloraceae cyanobacterium]